VNDSAPLPALPYDIAKWPRRYQKVDFVLGSDAPENNGADGDLELAAPAAGSNGAAERWRKDLTPLYPAALDLEFTDPETEWKVRPNTPRISSDDFLRLWTLNVGNADERPRDALHRSAKLSIRALQFAVMANGGALVALAFTMKSVDNSSGAGMAAAVVLALGLLFAGISLLAYLNFQLADTFWSAPAAKRGFEPNASAIAIPTSENPAYQAAQTKDVRITSRITASFWLATISGAGSYAALAVAAFWLSRMVIWH